MHKIINEESINFFSIDSKPDEYCDYDQRTNFSLILYISRQLLIISFVVQKIVNLTYSHLSNLLLFLVVLQTYTKKALLGDLMVSEVIQSQEGECHMFSESR
jgi:hypothetical protein